MRMNNAVFFILISSLCLMTNAKADDPAGGYLDGTIINCSGIDASSEATVVACNTAAYKEADKELNKVYADLINSADDKQKELLKKMQRAWIELKNAQCSFIAYYHRDVIEEKWQTECEAVMTIRRVQELKALGAGIKW